MFASFEENMNIADATFVEFKVSISIRILSAYMRYDNFTIYNIYTQPACCSTSSTNTIKQRTWMRRGNNNNDGIGYIWRVFSIFHLHILISSMRLHIYAGLISQSKKNKTCKHFDTDKNELHIENVKKKCPIVQNKYRKMALWWCRIL